MSFVQCRDELWVSSTIYAERSKVAQALRIEADDRYDDLYAPVIDALDLLLEQVASEVNDDEWKHGVQNVQAQLLAAMLRDCDRCDFFRGIYWALVDAGLIPADQQESANDRGVSDQDDFLPVAGAACDACGPPGRSGPGNDMKTHWLRLMHREALERLDDAEALRGVRPDSNASYLLELIAFELLLKFTAYTAEPANIERKKSFRHDYRKIFDALPPEVQGRLLTLAGERIGPSGLSDRNKVFIDWTSNFDGLRYPFEKYENDTAEEYDARGSAWLSEGGRLEDATFRFHSHELFGLLYALRIEAQERLQKLPQ